MPVSFFKQALQSGQRQWGRVTNKDALEGCVSGPMFVVSEGGLTVDEKDQLRVSLVNCPALAAFSQTDTDGMVEKFAEMVAKGPRMAAIQFEREVKEAVAKDASLGKTIAAIALDAADTGEDGLNPKEEARWRTLCGWCKVSPSDFGF